MIELTVVDTRSTYNMIVERLWLHAMKAVPCTYRQKEKFLMKRGVDEILGDQAETQVCYIKTLDEKVS